jgi:hypothetical protein
MIMDHESEPHTRHETCEGSSRNKERHDERISSFFNIRNRDIDIQIILFFNIKLLANVPMLYNRTHSFWHNTFWN